MPVDASTAWAVALYAALAIGPGLAVLAALGDAGGRGDAAPPGVIVPGGASGAPRAAAPGMDDPWVRLGLAAGIGLALQPLVYLWARTLGVPVGATTWWAVLAACAAGLGWRAWRRRSDRRTERAADEPRQADPSRSRPGPAVVGPTASAPGWPEPRWPHLALAAILALTLAARWWAARDLRVPLWGDSVHHTMIVDLFRSQGGLPESWLPFAPLSTFSYHFGLHAGVASLAALAALPAEVALIVAGQTLMVLQVLTAYALAAGLSGRPWAGVGAALAAAGLSTMPGFYVNWGRYTQLAGQVILPAAALAALGAAAGGGWRRPLDRAGLLAAIVVAGLALTHYLVTALFVLLALAWLAVGCGRWDRAGALARGAAAARLAAVAAVAFGLALPWLPRVLAGPLGAAAVALSTSRVANPDVYGVVSPWVVWQPDAVGRNVGWPLVAATALALAWALARRDRLAAVGVAWAGAMLLAAYPGLLGLPVTGVIKDFTVAIMLYLPCGLIVGGALGDAAARGGHGRAIPAALTAAVVLAAAACAWRQRAVVAPDNRLVMPADERAIAWVRDHTPPDAVFLVSSFSAFADSVQAGEDAGWWLPLLAAPRRTTLPPINYGIERSVDPGFREGVNALARLWSADLDAPATRAALAAAGVTHAYVGVKARQLDGDALAASPYWRPVYDAEGVRVFERAAR